MKLLPLDGKHRTALRQARLHRQTFLEGAVRSGKTVDAAVGILDLCRNAPPGDGLLIGYSSSSLRRNVLAPLEEMLGPERCRFGVTEGVIMGRHVNLMGAPNVRAENGLRGLTLAWAAVDENTLIPEAVHQQLNARLSVPGARLLSTTNPDRPAHWLLRDHISRARTTVQRDGTVTDESVRMTYDEGGARHWWSADNTELLDAVRVRYVLGDNKSLSAEYLANLRRENTGVFYRRNILGDWVAGEGVIYERLRVDLVSAVPADRRHLIEDDDLLRDADGDLIHHGMILAGDYGTSNATHVLLMAVLPCKDGVERIVVLREWEHSGRETRRSLADSEIIEALTAWVDGGCDGALRPGTGGRMLAGVVLDPSAASLKQEMRRRGWPAPRNAKNAVLPGIRSCASLIAADRVRLSVTCKVAIRQLEAYAWDPAAAAKGEDAPLKVDEHGCDAFRYGTAAFQSVWRHWQRIPGTDELSDDTPDPGL